MCLATSMHVLERMCVESVGVLGSAQSEHRGGDL